MRHASSSPAFRSSLLALLRGELPAADFPAGTIRSGLRRYECGGYLHHAWTAAGRAGLLPPVWAAELLADYRKIVVDNLAALADFRAFAAVLKQDTIPFVLLKGAAYLAGLYDDVGARRLTDIDLLIHPADAGSAARLLVRAGYQGVVGRHYPENRRFEMVPPGQDRCHFEVHWSLGVRGRDRLDVTGIRDRVRPCLLEDVPCGRLADEDGILYHVLHQADSYFGPSLKWAIDLRLMAARSRCDPAVLLERAAAWGVRTALYLALLHLEKIFPESGFPLRADQVRPGSIRRPLLGLFLAQDPLDLFRGADEGRAFHPLRLLMIDRTSDSARTALRVLGRPFARAAGRVATPWEWPAGSRPPDGE